MAELIKIQTLNHTYRAMCSNCRYAHYGVFDSSLDDYLPKICEQCGAKFEPKEAKR